MNSVWTVTEHREVESNLLEIVETKEIAENYVRTKFLLHTNSTNEWVVTEDQPDLKVWVDVVKDEFIEYEEPQDYFDDNDGACLVIKKWSVLKG